MDLSRVRSSSSSRVYKIYPVPQSSILGSKLFLVHDNYVILNIPKLYSLYILFI